MIEGWLSILRLTPVKRLKPNLRSYLMQSKNIFLILVLASILIRLSRSGRTSLQMTNNDGCWLLYMLHILFPSVKNN
jgi:hypothetical protein